MEFGLSKAGDLVANWQATVFRRASARVVGKRRSVSGQQYRNQNDSVVAMTLHGRARALPAGRRMFRQLQQSEPSKQAELDRRESGRSHVTRSYALGGPTVNRQCTA